MNRQTWIFLDDKQNRRKIALFHSPRDGKLLVQVDGETVIATVHAGGGGRWSFFIEEELCDIILARRGLEFSYGFEVNRKAPTDRNRAVLKRERLELWLPIGIFLTCLLLGAGLLFGRKFFFNKEAAASKSISTTALPDELAELAFHGKRTTAKFILTKNGNETIANYSFQTSSGSTTGRLFLKPNATGKIVLPNGLPLETGDEFAVTFLEKTPAVHQLDFMQLLENQLLTYEKRAAVFHQKLHPEMSLDYSFCLVERISKLKGLFGLADIFFQNASPAENSDHNRDSFGRLIRDETMKKLLLENCSPR